MPKRISGGWAAAVVLAMLAGCGGNGGGGDGASPSVGIGASVSPGSAPQVSATAEGVYSGTLAGTTSNGFRMLVLEDGSYVILYGTRVANLFVTLGYILGTGVSSNGAFTSADAMDYGVDPAGSGTLSGRYDPAAGTLSGSASIDGKAWTFAGGRPTEFLYDYHRPAALAAVAGDWTLASPNGNEVALHIGDDGVLTGRGREGCVANGRVSPRASGKNVFDVVMTVGTEFCIHAGETARGIAIAYPLPDGKTQLFLVTTTADRTLSGSGFATR